MNDELKWLYALLLFYNEEIIEYSDLSDRVIIYTYGRDRSSPIKLFYNEATTANGRYNEEIH